MSERLWAFSSRDMEKISVSKQLILKAEIFGMCLYIIKIYRKQSILKAEIFGMFSLLNDSL